MFVDSSGIAVQPIRPIGVDGDAIDRLRDVIMVKMHARRIGTRLIGRFLNVDHKTICNRLDAIPGEVYEHYRRTPVGALVGPVLEDDDA